MSLQSMEDLEIQSVRKEREKKKKRQRDERFDFKFKCHTNRKRSIKDSLYRGIDGKWRPT